MFCCYNPAPSRYNRSPITSARKHAQFNSKGEREYSLSRDILSHDLFNLRKQSRTLSVWLIGTPPYLFMNVAIEKRSSSQITTDAAIGLLTFRVTRCTQVKTIFSEMHERVKIRGWGILPYIKYQNISFFFLFIIHVHGQEQHFHCLKETKDVLFPESWPNLPTQALKPSAIGFP